VDGFVARSRSCLAASGGSITGLWISAAPSWRNSATSSSAVRFLRQLSLASTACEVRFKAVAIDNEDLPAARKGELRRKTGADLAENLRVG